MGPGKRSRDAGSLGQLLYGWCYSKTNEKESQQRHQRQYDYGVRMPKGPKHITTISSSSEGKQQVLVCSGCLSVGGESSIQRVFQ
jgi:hypothetical protein